MGDSGEEVIKSVRAKVRHQWMGMRLGKKAEVWLDIAFLHLTCECR
jgi:hypothetical protein